MKKLMSMVLSILFSLSLSSFAFAQAEEAKKAEKKIMPINAAALAIKVATIGGPTAIIEIDGYRIMTDPSLDSAGTEYPASVPLVKTMNPAMQVKEIGKIDLVSSQSCTRRSSGPSGQKIYDASEKYVYNRERRFPHQR